MSTGARAGVGRTRHRSSVANVNVLVTPQGGSTFTYDLASATQLPNFPTLSNGKVQQNYRMARNAGMLHLDIFYRPDTDGTRFEVVFELTDTTVVTGNHLGQYSVQLLLNGVAQTLWSGSSTGTTITTPRHHWLSRWRVYTPTGPTVASVPLPRPIITSVAALQAAGLFPTYDADTTGDYSSVTQYTPMGQASYITDWAEVADRDEIGLFPRWCQYYSCNEATAPNAKGQTYAGAEASGTFTFHIRDATGQIFNFETYTNWASRPGGFATNTIAIDPSPPNDLPSPQGPPSGGGWPTAYQHEPDYCYLAYRQTEDPYYVEEIQFIAATQSIGYGGYNGLGLPWYQVTQPFGYGQPGRAFAWTARTTHLAAAATPSGAATPLLPKAFWLRKAENIRKYWAALYINNPDPVIQNLWFLGAPQSYLPDSGGLPMTPWSMDYNAPVFAFLYQLGFGSFWQTMLQQYAINIHWRADGHLVSGWPAAWATWYNGAFDDGSTNGTTGGITIYNPPAYTVSTLLAKNNALYVANGSGYQGINPAYNTSDTPLVMDTDPVEGGAGDFASIMGSAIRSCIIAGVSTLGSIKTFIESQITAYEAPINYHKWKLSTSQPLGAAQPTTTYDTFNILATGNLTTPSQNYVMNAERWFVGQTGTSQTVTVNFPGGGGNVNKVIPYGDAAHSVGIVLFDFNNYFFTGIATIAFSDGHHYNCATGVFT